MFESESQTPAQKYTIKRKRLLQAKLIVLLGIPACFYAAGAADAVSYIGMSIFHNLYVTAGLVWASLFVVIFLANLVLSAIQFRIDRTFEVSRGGLEQRLVDAAKGSGVGFLFGIALIETVFMAMNLAGDRAWLVAAAGVSLLYALLVFAMPVLLPLFYRMTPIRDERLASRLRTLARHAGVRVQEVYEWQISGRTRRANALVAGFGRGRKIVLTDTMAQQFSDEEIEAIIAHELGHCAHQHLMKRALLQSALFVPIFWAVQQLVSYRLVPGAEQRWENAAFVPVFWCMWLMLSLYGNLVMARVARKQERQADRFAFEHVASVLPFISAMKKLTDLNLITYDKSSEWKYTHPATPERIAAAEKFAAERGQVAANAEAAIA